jgi:hypothetical protein
LRLQLTAFLFNTPRVCYPACNSYTDNTDFYWDLAAGQTSVSVESPKDNKVLIEANAIVRYFSAIGLNPWPKSGEEALKDYALIEFEESRQQLNLDVAESIISSAKFGQVR